MSLTDNEIYTEQRRFQLDCPVEQAADGWWSHTGRYRQFGDELIINVKQAGAAVDGVTNDSANIIAMAADLNSAGGGMLVYPPGTCLAAGIPLYTNVWHVGSGWSTKLVAPASATGNIFGEDFPSEARYYAAILNMQLDGNRASRAFPNDDAFGNSIRLANTHFSHIDRVYVHDSIFNAVSLYQANDNWVTNSYLNDTGKTGVPPGPSTFHAVFLEFGSNRNRIKNNRMSTMRTHGIFQQGDTAQTDDNWFIDNWIAFAGTDGIRCGEESGSSTQFNTQIKGNRIAGCTDTSIRVFHAGSASVGWTRIIDNQISAGLNGILVQAGAADTILRGNMVTGASVNNYANAGARTKDWGNLWDSTEANFLLSSGGGGYNTGHFRLGDYHLWVDSTGDLRIKSSAPASDLDGTVVGTQS